jgi:hypothetical protein
MAGAVGRGLTVSFLRRVLVGIVDYRTRERVSDDPKVRPAPQWVRIFEPSEDCPPVWRKGPAFPSTWHLIPGDLVTGKPDRSKSWMLGGNLGSTSDSRLRQIMDDQWWHVNATAVGTA